MGCSEAIDSAIKRELEPAKGWRRFPAGYRDNELLL
jgi:hypothetical protein